MKGLRKRSDRGVRFGIAHAKDAKDGMGNSDFGFRNSEFESRKSYSAET
jgi:hypothetical protein